MQAIEWMGVAFVRENDEGWISIMFLSVLHSILPLFPSTFVNLCLPRAPSFLSVFLVLHCLSFWTYPVWFLSTEEKPVGFRLKPPTLIHGQAPSAGKSAYPWARLNHALYVQHIHWCPHMLDPVRCCSTTLRMLYEGSGFRQRSLALCCFCCAVKSHGIFPRLILSLAHA